MIDSILNPIAFSILLTSLYVLRFRGWERPVAVALYFAFFLTLEVVVSHSFLPPEAFGPGLGYVCLGLSLPVVGATFFVWRQERRQADSDPGAHEA